MNRLLAFFLFPTALTLAQVPAGALRDADLSGPFKATVASPLVAHRGPLMRELEPLLIQQGRALTAQLRPWSVDPTAAHLPLEKGTASGEHGIRTNAATAKGLALVVRLLPDSAFPADFTHNQARAGTLALVRYLVRTHGASGETCADGKPWHNQWQSAYWAALTGEACWLLWDDLSPAERWLAARMICDEADRFVGVTPPTNLLNDSKAEENAWNSEIVSLAYNLFPAHPRHEIWHETAIRWIASSFCTGQDVGSNTVIDGRPLKAWLTAPNLHEDFTLENHNRVHPDYMACTYLLTSQLPMYAWGKNPPPAAINLNVEAINAVVKQLATPDGSVLYPNGQDWGLHRNIDWLEYHGTMAALYGDRQSAALLRHSIAAARGMAARNPTGTIYVPGETRLSSDQHMVLEYIAHTYALMAQLGEGPEPIPDAQLWSELAGTRVFESGKFGVARTKNSIATFSWGAQVMGQVLPLRDDLLLSPESRGLIGYVSADPLKPEIPIVKQVAVTDLKTGFGVTGVLTRASGTVEQRFGFLALPDGRAIYVDRLVLTGDKLPAVLDLGTLGVLNDMNWPFHDGKRTLTHQGGTHVFAAAEAAREPVAEFESPWFNLDGLGIVRLDASGRARYAPTPTSAAGRLEQRFHLNVTSPGTTAPAKAGAVIAHSVLVFYPNQTAAQTPGVATRCALLSAPGDSLVRLRLEEGEEVSFDLSALRLARTPPASTPATMLALARRVTERQLALPRAHHADSWMRSALYVGILALAESAAEPRYADEIFRIAQDLQWRLKPRVYDADDHAIGQTYLELFFRRSDPAMLAPLRERFDFILAHPKDGSVDRNQNPEPRTTWSWCDALFMAPPVWAGLARATGRNEYLDFALTHWAQTSDFLYDREAHLFHRDSGSMTRREPNGAKVFWGRGNGWAIAGLARLLNYLPKEHPARARLEQQLREMAVALVAVQQSDGLWRSSLLDPTSFPAAETSGSGLICYALAWGINHGVLDRATFTPAVLQAWQGLAECVTPDGKVTHVQGIGSEPSNFVPQQTEEYGVGAFLLAASEVHRVVPPAKL